MSVNPPIDSARQAVYESTIFGGTHKIITALFTNLTKTLEKHAENFTPEEEAENDQILDALTEDLLPLLGRSIIKLEDNIIEATQRAPMVQMTVDDVDKALTSIQIEGVDEQTLAEELADTSAITVVHTLNNNEPPAGGIMGKKKGKHKKQKQKKNKHKNKQKKEEESPEIDVFRGQVDLRKATIERNFNCRVHAPERFARGGRNITRKGLGTADQTIKLLLEAKPTDKETSNQTE